MLGELFASLPVTEKEGFEPSISVLQQKRWCGCLARVLGAAFGGLSWAEAA